MKQLIVGFIGIVIAFSVGVWIKTGDVEWALFVLLYAFIGGPVFVGCLWILISLTVFFEFPMRERRKMADEMDKEYNGRFGKDSNGHKTER